MGLQDSELLKKYINFDEKRAGSSSRAIMYGLLATFGGFLFGYDTGTISGVMAMDYVKSHFPDNKTNFTSGESSLIVSILSVGTFCGALAAPLFSDRIGRRWTIILSTLIVFNLGVILQTAASEKNLLIAGRAIAGLGVGLLSSLVPIFISETAPKWIRGSIVSTYQFMVTVGLLVAACANKGCSNRNDSGSYRIPIGIQLAWGLLLGIGFFFAPDTPRFWISVSKEEKAKESLSRLRQLPVDHPDLIDEYEEIKANFEYESQFGNASWAQVFKNVNRQPRRLFTGCALQALQQLTGINFIFYFGTQFFTSSGIDDPFLIQLATNIVNVGLTIPGIVLIETWGRRNLMLFGSAIMTVSQLIVAIVGVAQPDSKAANQTLVAFSCIFIAGFACSWGPLAWTICSENFSLNVRQKSISITTSFNWLFNFAIAYATPYLVDSGKGNADLGSKVFFIWGGCNVIGCIFVYFMVFEAKGLSLEQVDEMYMKTRYAWQSKNFVPSVHAFRDETTSVHRISSEMKDNVVHVEEDSV